MSKCERKAFGQVALWRWKIKAMPAGRQAVQVRPRWRSLSAFKPVGLTFPLHIAELSYSRLAALSSNLPDADG